MIIVYCSYFPLGYYFEGGIVIIELIFGNKSGDKRFYSARATYEREEGDWGGGGEGRAERSRVKVEQTGTVLLRHFCKNNNPSD